MSLSLSHPTFAARQVPIRETTSRSVPRQTASVRFWGRILTVVVVLLWGVGLVVGFERALLFLTLVGFGAAVAGLVRPGLGLLGVGMLCALDPLTTYFLLRGGLWRWNTFNYWLLIVMVLFLPTLWRLRGLPVRMIQVLAAVLALGLLQTTGMKEGVQNILAMIVWFGLVIYFQRGALGTENWYWLGVVCGAVAAAGGLVYYLKRSDLREFNPNAMSMFPLTGLFAICLAYPFCRGRVRRQVIFAALAAINCLWIFLTGSRGSTVVAAACVVFLFTQTEGRKRGGILVVAALLAAVVGSQFADRSEYARERIDRLFDREQSMESRTSGRFDLGLGAWYIFLDNPLGVGTGGFGQAWARLDSGKGLSRFKRGEVYPAHSAWLNVLAENGVPGFVAMAAFVASFGWVGWRVRRQRVLPVALLVTFSLALLFLSVEFGQKGTWFLAAGAMAILLRARASERRALAKARVATGVSIQRSLRGI